MSLAKLVEQYKLSASGHELWTPYWINEAGTPEGIYAGKGSPEQIQAKLNQLAEEYSDPLNSGEEVRYLMLRNGLGVDCSGFAFHVLDAYLQSQGKGKLAEHLFVSKADILEAMEKKESWRKVERAEVEGWSEQVSLAEACERFGKDPAHQTNVARLCDGAASVEVRPADLQPADLVYLKAQNGDHLLVITEVEGDQISYTESRFDPVGPGGIVTTKATKTELKLSPKYQLVGMRRLKPLA